MNRMNPPQLPSISAFRMIKEKRPYNNENISPNLFFIIIHIIYREIALKNASTDGTLLFIWVKFS